MHVGSRSFDTGVQEGGWMKGEKGLYIDIVVQCTSSSKLFSNGESSSRGNG
jgi:hypothetical protein